MTCCFDWSLLFLFQFFFGGNFLPPALLIKTKKQKNVLSVAFQLNCMGNSGRRGKLLLFFSWFEENLHFCGSLCLLFPPQVSRQEKLIIWSEILFQEPKNPDNDCAKGEVLTLCFASSSLDLFSGYQGQSSPLFHQSIAPIYALLFNLCHSDCCLYRLCLCLQGISWCCIAWRFNRLVSPTSTAQLYHHTCHQQTHHLCAPKAFMHAYWIATKAAINNFYKFGFFKKLNMKI